MRGTADHGQAELCDERICSAAISGLESSGSCWNGYGGRSGRTGDESIGSVGRDTISDIITSAAERQSAAEFARARSVRPKLVGEALREIGQDPEVLDAVFETLEVDRIVEVTPM